MINFHAFELERLDKNKKKMKKKNNDSIFAKPQNSYIKCDGKFILRLYHDERKWENSDEILSGVNLSKELHKRINTFRNKSSTFSNFLIFNMGMFHILSTQSDNINSLKIQLFAIVLASWHKNFCTNTWNFSFWKLNRTKDKTISSDIIHTNPTAGGWCVCCTFCKFKAKWNDMDFIIALMSAWEMLMLGAA